MQAPRTILVVASEPSGSRMAAPLMAELNRRFPGQLVWYGVGGPEMEAEGLQPLFSMTELAVMGLVEILPAIPRLRRRLQQLRAWAEAERPALVLTVDGQEFSKRLGLALRPLGVPHVQYVAPKVWAWRPGRVKTLRRAFTEVLCNLPFEAPWFRAAGLPTTYVGHPAITTLASVAKPAHPALQLALLPGSRSMELSRHWPVMLATYRRLRKLLPNLHGVLVLHDAKAEARCRALAAWEETEGLQVVSGEARFAALAASRAALAKSGTNNLEMALLGVPAVVCYAMNPLTYQLAKRLVQVPSISLPNLIMNPPELPAGQLAPGPVAPGVYPEFIQAAVKEENLARALYPLLTETKAVEAQQARLAEVGRRMATPQPPAVQAADVVARRLGLA